MPKKRPCSFATEPAHPAAAGNALVLAVVVAAILAIAAGGYVSYGIVRSHAARAAREAELARSVADGALGLAIEEIDRAVSAREAPSALLLGSVADDPGTGTPWAVAIRPHEEKPQLFKVSACAVTREAYHTVQVIVERFPDRPPVPAAFRGAMSSYFGFVLKNVTVNGNDHLPSGEPANPAGDTFAISHKEGDTAFQGGAGKLAGCGTELNHEITPECVDPTYGEAIFPTTPFEALGIEAWPAKAIQFDTPEAWTAFREGLPDGRMPPHQLLVLNFKESAEKGPFTGIDWGTSQHVLVWHYPDPSVNNDPDAPKGVSFGKNLHLGSQAQPFKGIAILDAWDHVNGSAYVRGAFLSLSGQLALGLQGNTVIEYSSEAVGGALGGTGLPGGKGWPRVVSYREGVLDAEALEALQQAGKTLDTEPQEGSEGWHTPGEEDLAE